MVVKYYLVNLNLIYNKIYIMRVCLLFINILPKYNLNDKKIIRIFVL